jgi:hypothetical protein
MLLYERQNLPVRWPRQPGESLAGYVYRLYDANGHTVPRPYSASLTILYGRNSEEDRRRAASEISRLIGPVPESDWPRCQEPHGWQKQSASRMRSCPMCMRENEFHRALWELPLVHACPYHRVKLRDHCDCGKALAWRGLSGDWRCRCGASLKQLRVERADKVLLILSRVVCTCAGDGDRADHGTDWGLDPQLSRMSLDEIYARADFLHKLDSRFVLSLNERSRHPRFPGASTGRFFFDCKNDVRDYIERWISNLFKKSQDSPIIMLPRHSTVTRLLQVLHESREINDGSSAARTDTLEVIQRHLVPTRWSATVLLGATVDRELLRARLQSFFALTDRACFPPGGTQANAELDITRRGAPQRKELRLLLSRLVNGLMRGDLPSDYRRAALAWPPLADFAGDSGEEWLAHIIEPLYSASLTHLRYLSECFDLSSGGAGDGSGD